jgi:hypothetical protein
MTHHMRPLTPLEVDTLRVALALLLTTPPRSLDLIDARAETEVNTIANDEITAQLLDELHGAEVSVRRAPAESADLVKTLAFCNEVLVKANASHLLGQSRGQVVALEADEAYRTIMRAAADAKDPSV